LSFSSVAALVVVVGFAFMLGVSDAPNASAVLIASRAASYRRAMAFSFVASAVGGLLAGEAVAQTMRSLVHVSAVQLPGTYLAGGVASLMFTLVLTRRSIPVSASIALVGGLAGAAIAEGGWQAVGWGGLHGVRPYGVVGSLLAIFLSPAFVLATGTAAGGRRIVRTVSSRFYRGGLLDGLAAQTASAMVILGGGALGAPVSTSAVVASGMVGVGAARRRRHVHWPTVRSVVSAWVITAPACAVLGALLVELGGVITAKRWRS
jgi:phosphate/sulfate permease